MRGGFELIKWIFNFCSVLLVFLVEERVFIIKSLDLKLEGLFIYRVLGIYWNVEYDIIDFVVNDKECLENWKGVLLFIVIVYDLFGFVSFLFLFGREMN